ncbi:stage III sporulation protein AB [Paludicola sp. MB14-C6]|uniref:stage III sporulation protein AB n=1 Tax=Paludihabitans sp. MB14-C6 TaxID=3070656 RepID=UPI0027DE0E76|nr:stage III sporulation protein AB [Paludicola sp. MB14-C6]WMJ23021.1 stage III sporulation protein AB [Paludicola sp. MB14-C6]
MLKIILCPFFIFVGAYVGFAFSKRFQKRVKQLDLLTIMLQRIRVYLEYEKTPTKLLISKLAESESLQELSFLRRCKDKMETNINFPIVWQESLSECKQQLALEQDDYTALNQLTEVLGVYDAQAQLSGILVLETMMKQQLEEAIEQNKTMGKLYRSLGILSGIAAAILVI